MDFQRNFPEAEKWYIKALGIRKEISGTHHLDYTSTLNNLAGLYVDMGQYEKSEALFLEALDILEAMFGKDHQEYIGGLNNLGILYRMKGEYERALPLFLTVQEKGIKIWGADHLYYATCMNSLGNLYQNTGQYEKAESHYQQAREIWARQLGEDHPYYTASLNNLAILYKNLGNLEKAEALLIESNAIREKVLGRNDPEYAFGLKSLANVYKLTGEYEKADSLYLLVGRYLRESLGEDAPDYAKYLSDLAGFELRKGMYAHAEALYQRALEIFQQAYGQGNEHYAIGLNNLAMLYEELKHHAQAEALFLKSQSILVDVQGQQHPENASVLYNLVKLYGATGRYDQMEKYLMELSLVQDQSFQDAMLHLSEQELEKYLNKYMSYQDLAMSFAHLTRRPDRVELGFDNCIAYKGILLESAIQVRRRALSESVTADIYHRMIGCHRRLARLYAQPIAERDSILIETNEDTAEELEKQLARMVAGYGQAQSQVHWQDIQAALRPGEAALEIIRFRQQFQDDDHRGIYAALLLLPGEDRPRWITLFEEVTLDSLLHNHGERRADFVNHLYTFTGRGLIVADTPVKTLYELIWEPLEEHLSGARTIYYAPSGLLHRINLGAIPLDRQTTLSDHYQFIQVNSTRQIVSHSELVSTRDKAVLFGGIRYDLDSTALVTANADLVSAEWDTHRINDVYRADPALPAQVWHELNWTLDEVTAIDGLLRSAGYSTSLCTAYASSEEAFRAMGQAGPSPHVIHLATHGFFFSDPDPSSTGTSATDKYEPVFKVSDNPMIRSGLILAGGNHAWQNKPVPAGMEDGILTAYEISQMNLSNTELVVLSACETGLGDIQGNEGVYGLQRAFKIAGAKYLIMSLWQVPDRQTMQFMTTFYRHWLEGKMTIPEAFRKTQLEMRDRFFDAYNWAGFVLVE